MIVDCFAGGGGASLGIERALGVSPDIAINHDRAALAVHAANHPHTEHLRTDVYDEIERLRAELAALRAERDRDGDLLDWLERNPRHESAPYFDDEAGAWGFPYEVSNAGGHGGGVGFRHFGSLRAAIDAAMRAER